MTTAADFTSKTLTLVDQVLTEGLTFGPGLVVMVRIAKDLTSGSPDPTPEQWAALDTEEQLLSDQIDAAAKAQ